MTGPRLTTRRMILRPYEGGDFSCFAALNANQLVRQHVGTGETLSEGSSRALFDAVVSRPRDHIQAWAAVIAETSRYVGHVFLTARCGDTRPELGFLFDPSVWGRGLATEAARTAADYALNERDANEVVATVDCDHAAAIRVLEKIGMELRSRPSDERGEYLLYSIRRADFSR